jgi:hypothetical protein
MMKELAGKEVRMKAHNLKIQLLAAQDQDSK